jgi:hypothetical protein
VKAEEPKRSIHPALHYILNGLHPTVADFARWKGYELEDLTNFRRGCREKQEEEGLSRLATNLSMPLELATYLRYCQRKTTH